MLEKRDTVLEKADTGVKFNYLLHSMKIKKTCAFWIISIIITVTWIVLSFLGILDWFDLKVSDYSISHSPPINQDSNIVVVEYDDKTAENLATPATRLDIAALIQIIEEQNPRVLALDLFSMSGLFNSEDTTKLFEEIISQYDNICYGVGFIVPIEKSGKSKNPEEFKYLENFLYPLDRFKCEPYQAEHLFKPINSYYTDSKSIGHLVLKNDADGVFRRIPASIQCGNGALLSLGLQAAVDFQMLPKEAVQLNGSEIQIINDKTTKIPLDRRAQMKIRYNDKRSTIKEISMIDIFIAYKHPDGRQSNLNLLKDKLVFIGNTSSRTARFCATPLYPYYPTILIHANVANNVLQRSFLQDMHQGIYILLIILLGILYTLIIVYSKNILRLFLWLIIFLIMVSASGYMLVTKLNYCIPLFSISSFILFLSGSLLVYRYINYKEYLLISLRELQEVMRLKERLAAIGEVSSKIAHEIRNPLNAIQLYSSLIKRECENNKEAQGYVNIINEESLRLNRFITRLLGYARPKKLDLKPLNLKNELTYLVTLLTPDLSANEIRVDIRRVTDDMTIYVDPDQMREAFINVAKNSVEAMEKGGTLEIYSEPCKEYTAVFFKDNGKGIQKNVLDKIFTPFFSTKKQGTGLGLPMVKNIIEAHNGTISVESKEGEGTVVEIRLPLKNKTA